MRKPGPKYALARRTSLTAASRSLFAIASIASSGLLAACSPAAVGEGDHPPSADAWLHSTFARNPAPAALVAQARPLTHDGESPVLVSNGIEARFAAGGYDALRLRPLADSRAVVVQRLRGSTSVPISASTNATTVVLENASTGVDAVVFASDVIEELDVLRDADASVAYELALPDGFTLRVERNGAAVDVIDARGLSWMRVAADHAWDASGNEVHVGWSISGSSIRLIADAPAKWPILVDPSWTSAGNTLAVRDGQSATLLSDGRVLIAGGITYPALLETLATAEIYDPRTDKFTPTGSMATPRFFHAATLLEDGRVLVTGGQYFTPPDTTTYVASAEVWNPKTNAFTVVGSLATERTFHAATLLNSGKVLVVGGANASGSVASGELFDPSTGLFTPAGNLSAKRGQVAAARLADGRVLVAGGANGTTFYASADIYDPAANGFVPTGAMATARERNTMTLLRDGRVLVAGGENSSGALASEELFEPSANFGAGAFVPTGTMPTKRSRHMAALLPSGQVLLTAGQDGTTFLFESDIYDPPTGGCSNVGAAMSTARDDASATMLASGQVLVVGGGSNALAETFDPLGGGTEGTTSAATPMGAARAGQTATRLPTGKILIAGGTDASGNPLATAELFDPTAPGAGAFVATGSMTTVRARHAATLLPNGTVLLTGGLGAGATTNASAEIFDPDASGGAGAFTAVGSMAGARSSHTSTLLASGQVLIAGGIAGTLSSLSTAELFDPAKKAFVPLANLLSPRAGHTATLLASGAVLLVGGLQSSTAELYEPGPNGVGTFIATGVPAQPRVSHTATLLPSGKVLLAGGANPTVPLASCEIFDPDGSGGVGSFGATASLATARSGHVAVLLPSGKVLVAGGCNVTDCTTRTASAELYDPSANAGVGTFASTTSLSEPRDGGAAALLPTGDVLVTGGATMTANATASADRWSDGAPIANAWRPAITTVPSSAQSGTPIAIAGVGFIGISEGSSGRTISSASNNPVPIWMPVGGGMLLGAAAPFQSTTATWTPPASALVGPGWLHLAVDGIIGPGRYVALTQAPAGVACVVAAQCASGFCVDGVCCADACDTPCLACAAAKKASATADGVCGPIAANTDPDNECGVQASSTCGTTGVCDGAGHCAMYQAGTLCAPSSCSGVILSSAYVCDGAGTCTATPVVNCSPFLCQGPAGSAACTTSCASNSDCAPGAFCSGGVCKNPQPNGTPCTSPAECQSLQCVDGVCCNSDCSGTCLACSAAKKASGVDGVCGPVANGQDPNGDCADEGATSCGFDGTCNGAGSCRYYSAATPCGATSCADGMNGAHSKQGGQFCDGLGACGIAQGLDCSLYKCNGDTCGTSCQASSDCIVSAYCDEGGVCQPKHANADPCTYDYQCETNHCVDGVCCNSACAGQCEACDVLDELGLCWPVAGVPHGNRQPCTNTDPACGGTCDGTTTLVCTYPGSDVACGAWTCTDGVAHEHHCGVKGVCDPTAVDVKCESFSCGATACKTSCVTDDDCNPLFRCDQGDCIPGVSTICDGDHTLVGSHGQQLDCTPYRCISANVCLSYCTSTADCVLGAQCSADGKCTTRALPFVPDAACACRAVGAPDAPRGGNAAAALLAAIALALARAGSRARPTRRFAGPRCSRADRTRRLRDRRPTP